MIQRFGEHHPAVAATAFVHPLACLIGEVSVADHATIWPGAVLRGDEGILEVGESSNIQDGTVLHNLGGFSTTHIGARVTVGHRVILHGCIVEDDCLIGMGSIIMDNARIGTGSLIGAGAVIPPNTIIPPNSYVLGVPGRVIRRTGEREKQMIATGWRTYVDLGQRYAASTD